MQRQESGRGSRNSICSGSVSVRRWPSSTAIAMARFQRLFARVATIEASASRTGPGPVVELDRTADVDAAGIDLQRGTRRTQRSNSARRRGRPRGSFIAGKKTSSSKTQVVFPDHRDLQFLARAEVGEDTRLAHLHHLGQRTDRQGLPAPCARPGRARRRGSPHASAGPSATNGARRSRGAAVAGW